MKNLMEKSLFWRRGWKPWLEHGLLTVPLPATEGLPLQQRGDLRSARGHGQETVPQHGAAPARRALGYHTYSNTMRTLPLAKRTGTSNSALPPDWRTFD